MLHSPWAFTARDARPNDWSGAIVKSQLLGASSMPGRRCPKLPSHRGRTVGYRIDMALEGCIDLFNVLGERGGDFRLRPAELHLQRQEHDADRADSAGGPKDRHFALMCWSDAPLSIRRGVPFDPSAYRNAGGNGAPVGASQVTALLKRTSNGAGETGYEANMCAWLSESYWVRLSDPVECDVDMAEADDLDTSSTAAWLEFVDRVRDGDRRPHDAAAQTGLLI